MTIRAVEAAVEPEAHRLPGGVLEVAVLAWPAVLQTLSDTAMQVVDSAIVGRLGVTELAAVGFGGIWVWTVMVAFVGTATGVQTFVAQNFGAGRRHDCGAWVWQGLYALLPLAVLWTVLIIMVFAPLLDLLGPSVEVRGLANAYARARLLGAPALVADVVFTSFFRGLGDTRTPLRATVGANLLNAALAYGLVFGCFGLPAWGIAGAGMATAIAHWTYCGIMLFALFRQRTVQRFGTLPVIPEFASMRRFMRVSVPIGGQWVLDMASFAVFSTIIARMGDAAMAASQAMIQLLALSFMQAVGISIAAAALVGQYVGAGDFVSATRSHHSALKLGLVLAAGVALLFLSAPDVLLHVFTVDPTVISLGRPLLAIGALFQLLDAMGIIASGSLRGAGDTRWPFWVSASLAWCVRLPLVYVLAVTLGRGVVGAWAGELLYVFVLGSIWLWRFRAGVWRTVQI